MSAHAALRLPHALELFGGDFKVHLSTGVTFHPDTAARAVLDCSIDAAVRKALPSHHQALRKLLYIAAGRHRPSETTKKALLKDFELFVPPEEMRRALDGHNSPAAQSSDWAVLLKGLQGEGEVFQDIATCLAACDAHLLEFVNPLAVQHGRPVADKYLNKLFENERAAWQALNPRLLTHVWLLAEVSMKTLAWLECRLTPPSGVRNLERSGVDGLLQDRRRPMGNWVSEVCKASGCRNMGELSAKLRWRTSYLGRPITHDLLRKWSSSKKLMPRAALMPVLAAVQLRSQTDLLRSRFYVARFFMFVCALLRAGTQGTRPDWNEVQAQLRGRYAHAYRLQVGQVQACQSPACDAGPR